MIKKQKLALLSVAGILGALALGVTAATGGSGVIRTYGGDASVWKHYAAVAATETTHGSKEFWARCTPGADDKYGVRVFNAGEVSGTIEEGGDIKSTVFWNDIVEGDDRYVAPLNSTITFDARGGVAVAEGKYSYGTEASSLPTTTREADDYYESYEFGGWYKDGVAYDKVAGSATVKASWKYGDAKKVYINDWKAEDFTLDGLVQKKVADVAGCTLSDDEGFVFRGTDDTLNNTVTIPKINFSSILDTVPVIYMYVGGYNSNNQMFATTADSVRTRLFLNGSTNDAAQMTKARLRFTKDSSGDVHMHFADTPLADPIGYDGRANRTGDLTLSETQANGTEGILFDVKNRAAWRYFWLGRPYYLSGEENYWDVTTKTHYVVDGGDVKNKSEHTTGTGSSYWYDIVGGADERVAIVGNSTSGGAKLSFDAINFNELFAAKKGLKFTIGSWNGNEHFYFGDVDLGTNGPDKAGIDNYNVDEIEKTFNNWEITIDDIGFHAYNKNEGKTYDASLTNGQIAGKDSVTMTLGKVSASRCFFLYDVVTYHI